MNPLVLSLCDRTGHAVEPWARAGYECWTIDLRHPPGVGPLVDGVRKVGADVTRFCPPLGRPVAFVSAFPPCTHLAVSGARWFKLKGLNSLADALAVVAACNRICEASGAPFFLENPVSTLSSYWRKPDYSIDPCDYAGYLDDPAPEAYTKKTCLWVGGGFILPAPKPVPPALGSMMHRLPPSDDRADLRSATPRGFSRAVFEANVRRSMAVRSARPNESIPTALHE